MGGALKAEVFAKLKNYRTWAVSPKPDAMAKQNDKDAASSSGCAASVNEMKSALWMASQRGFKVDGFCYQSGSDELLRIKALTEEEATLVKRLHGRDHGEDVKITMHKLLEDLVVCKTATQAIVKYEASDVAISHKAWSEEVVVHGASVALRQKTMRARSSDPMNHITLLCDPVAVQVNKGFAQGAISIHRGSRHVRARSSATYHISRAALQGRQGYMVCDDVFEFIGVLLCSCFSCTHTHALICEVASQAVVSSGSSQHLAK